METTSLPQLYISDTVGHHVCWCYDRLDDLHLCNVSERVVPLPYHCLTSTITTGITTTMPLPNPEHYHTTTTTYYLLPLTCHYHHHYHCQGRSQDFLLGGANLVRGPMSRVPPKLNTPRVWSTIFWKGSQFTCKAKK